MTAIIATGTAVLLAYRVRSVASASGADVGRLTGRTIATVVGMVLLVAVPLGLGTIRAVGDHRVELAATPLAVAWAESQGWRIVSVEVDDGALRVLALGPPPELEPASLRDQLDEAGIELDLVVGGTRTVPARSLTPAG